MKPFLQNTDLQLDDRIDLICDRLEESWKSDSPIAIDYLLRDFSSQEQPAALRALMAVEIERRFSRGEQLVKGEYLERWPQHNEMISKIFDSAVAELLNPALPITVHIGSTILVATSSTVSENHPQRIGKYAVIEQLDRGGQATIYRAVHPDLRRDVVIKFCHITKSTNAASKEALAVEGRVLASLEHPNLARVYDFDVHESRAYLVMEFVRGLNLSQYRKQHAVQISQWISIVRQVAEALQYVHSRGVLHLDIKPQNILLDETSKPRLIDFGLSRTETMWNQMGPDTANVIGTLQYMPPEQANCQADFIGPKSDIFSLGGVLYYLATGYVPIEGNSCKECLENARAGNWNRERLSVTDPKLRKIIEQAMEKNPAARFENADELARALKALEAKAIPSRIMFAISAAIILMGLGIAFGISRLRQPPGVLPSTLAMNIRVCRNEIFFDLSDSAPLGLGDRVEITSEVPAGMYMSLFLFDSEGQLQLVDSKPAAGKAYRYRFPGEPSHFESIDGPPGTEFVFLCGRRDRAITAEDLIVTGLFDKAWPKLPEDTVLQVLPSEVEYVQSSRGFGGSIATVDPQQQVFSRLELLRQAVSEQDSIVEGLAFSHVE